ncbi:hypothetical protein FHT78_005821 [Rhizobium sp. BK196]|uniref:hypothetical protein n=1 Tax=Rhizobium sp. BK196 TaxID=2587073 RepID=UPI0016083C33|nr:hypothetical protein [Rhizobium sp. BK196]MBB3314014.1 hypothetical protein [Rhizobium sp. BK196]
MPSDKGARSTLSPAGISSFFEAPAAIVRRDDTHEADPENKMVAEISAPSSRTCSSATATSTPAFSNGKAVKEILNTSVKRQPDPRPKKRTTMILPKRHHYVPEMLQKNFVDEDDRLWTFDSRNRGRGIWRSSYENLFLEGISIAISIRNAQKTLTGEIFSDLESELLPSPASYRCGAA